MFFKKTIVRVFTDNEYDREVRQIQHQLWSGLEIKPLTIYLLAERQWISLIIIILTLSRQNGVGAFLLFNAKRPS